MSEDNPTGRRLARIAILGMHRSGTSATANLIEELGAYLGDPREMLGPAPSNERGFYERADVMTVNDKILQRAGGSWHTPPSFPVGYQRLPTWSDLTTTARDLLDRLAAAAPDDAEAIAVKDPRFCLTLDIWRVWRPFDRHVLSVRHPDEVARSLAARDGFDVEWSARLWLRHVAQALVLVEDPFVVLYDALVAEPVQVAERLKTYLSLPGAPERAGAVVRRELRHHVGDRSPERAGPRTAQARALHALLAESQLDEAREVGRVLLAELEGEGTGGVGTEAPAAVVRSPVGGRREGPASREASGSVADPRATGSAASARETTNPEPSTPVRTARTDEEMRAARAKVSTLERALRQERKRTAEWERRYRSLRGRRSVRLALKATSQLSAVVRGVGRRRATPQRAPVRSTSGTPSEQDVRRVAAALADSSASSTRVDGPLVSIIVLNRDGEGHLRRLLPALERTEYRNLEVLVVDNASSDASLGMLEGWSPFFPVQILRNEHNASFSDGNNQALAEAHGELVLFLNNDIEPITSDWLGRMIDTLLTRDAGAVGARLVYPRRAVDGDVERGHPDLSLQHRGIHFEQLGDGVPRGRNLGGGDDPLSADACSVRELPAVTAACLLARRSALDEVGGFTSGYLYGTEDVDLCLKLRSAGWRVVYDGGAVLWHHEFGTQNELARARKRHNRLHNRRLFADRWGPQLTREVLADRIRGGRFWSEEPLHVGLTITRAARRKAHGDWFTAHELGDALQAAGWRVSYLERYEDRWYDIPDDLDVVIVLLDQFDLSRLPRHVISVAWVRNWTDRWVEHPWFDDYDVVLASSQRSLEIIEERTSRVPYLFPIAANAERFHPDAAASGEPCDVLFVGSYWGESRRVTELLALLPPELDVRLHGRNWNKHPTVSYLDSGPLGYEHLAGSLAAARIVVDDTASPTKPYNAVNTRVFDALAAGTLVLSDNTGGIREVFGDDLPTWETPSEGAELVRDLLKDDARRAQLVERHRHMVLENHTYEHRAERLRELLLGWVEAERWSVLIGAPNRRTEHRWGDLHYARALQRQLERSGRPTRVLRLPEWHQPSAAMTDVEVHLFGLSQHRPRSAQQSFLWIISHPELVTESQCERYDRVFVASERFADDLSGRVEVPVEVLHQATDPDRFHPCDGGPRHELLFVGNSRKVRRRILDDLLPTPHDVAIYGAGWTSDLVDTSLVVSDHIPNQELARYYSGAAIVLNDHWDDMREHAFPSNRLFDALACGACVVSDHIDGLDELFGGAVATYREPSDLHDLVGQLLLDPVERHRRGELGRSIVFGQHTFAHRVERLIGCVGDLRRHGWIVPDGVRAEPGAEHGRPVAVSR